MMTRKVVCCVAVLLAVGVARAEEPAEGGDQLVSGMSIVGNDEAPKSLAIVAWNGSELGDTLNALRALNAGLEPVDKEVFMRLLDYYQIMAGSQATQPPASQVHKNQ